MVYASNRGDNGRVPNESEEPLYDPDRMRFEDLDLSNLEAVDAYLDHPVTQALHEDLGRLSRQEPASVQRAEIERELVQCQAYRMEVAEAIIELDDSEDDKRTALLKLQDGLDGFIEGCQRRLSET